ncbi:MAG: hypothetical protein HPY76_01770 [Anaerolineae bacterium]|nr:hypothetical protein [Anaerolineae bacterium]
MKTAFWNVLSIMALLAACITAALMAQVFANPHSGLNPFPPPTLPPVLELPTHTPTLVRLPATWTPTPGELMLPTIANSATPLSSPTEFSLNTPTSTVTETPEVSLTPTGKPDDALWISNSPPDYSTFSPGQDFDMVWIVRNTGTSTWNSTYSYRYQRGEKAHKKDNYHLKTTVPPGASVELIVDMNAPTEPGNYNLYWELVNESGQGFYTVNFVFTVR